jgi:hypothetical protein
MTRHLRFFPAVLLGAVLAFLLPAPWGSFVLAAPSLPNGIDLPTGVNLPEGDIRIKIVDVLNFVLSFLALVAVIAIIVAGFMLILGFGSETSAQRAKKIIIYTVVGLIVIFFARVIVQFFLELPV